MKKFTLTFLLIYVCIQAIAQIKFSAKTNLPKIGINQAVEIIYEVENANLDDFNQPAFTNWKIVGGPSQFSSSFSNNGVVSSKSSISFFLQPTKKGKLVIEGTTAVINGKKLTCNNVIVEVVEKDVAMDNASNNQPVFPGLDPLFDPEPIQPEQVFNESLTYKDGDDLNKKASQNLMLKISVNKNSCYEGEPIVATYKILTQLNMDAKVSKRPSFSGFSSYELPDTTNSEYTIENIGGKPFKAYLLRRVQLYALQSGPQVLEPFEIESNIRFRKVIGGQLSNFDSTIVYTAKCDAVTINVLPLPQNKPDAFSGAVGEFKTIANLSNVEIPKNGSGKLIIEITGAGNWAMVQAPIINWPTGIEGFEPQSRELLNNTDIPISGSRYFEYAFSPKDTGFKTLPIVSFSYFDIKSKNYKTISTEPIKIYVTKEQKRLFDNDKQPATFTELFTDAAKWILPIAAVLLAFLLLIRRKKNPIKEKTNLQNDDDEHIDEKLAMEAMQRKKIEEVDVEIVKENYMPTELKSAIETSNSTNLPYHTEIKPAEAVFIDNAHSAFLPPSAIKEVETPIIEKEIDTEINTTQINDSKEFYQLQKDKLYSIVEHKLQSKITELTFLKDQLMQKGLDYRIATRILQLINTCNQQLYSPLPLPVNKEQLLFEINQLEKDLLN